MTRDWSGYGPTGSKATRRQRLGRYLRLSFYDLQMWMQIRSEQFWGWVKWNLKGRRG
jgi:hypothetical protein